MSSIRKDPVTRTWVVMAPERGLRPSDFLPSRGGLQSGGVCPFCPGNEEMTPGAIVSVPQGPDWLVRVVPNQFPALGTGVPLEREGDGPYDRVSGFGAHEVIIETPRHHETLGEMQPFERAEVLRVYRERLVDLARDERMRWAVVFKNRGAEAGASIRHEHSQLMALPLVPREPQARLEGAAAHFERTERCVYCDILRHELRAGARLVAENEAFVAFCPYASRQPFETWILPRRHVSHFGLVEDGELLPLADLLGRVLQKIDRALDKPAINFMLQSAPLREGPSPSFHWHLEIIPALLRTGGFERASGYYINATPPEEAALFLRGEQT